MPISITENGLPCHDELGPDGTIEDHARITFLRDHFASAHQAIEAGVPLESYHVWSLLDNFEWQQGYAERWGLVYVDYVTQQRILKRSAQWYRDVIARNGI
jgi:beta-glucosidase